MTPMPRRTVPLVPAVRCVVDTFRTGVPPNHLPASLAQGLASGWALCDLPVAAQTMSAISCCRADGHSLGHGWVVAVAEVQAQERSQTASRRSGSR